MKKRIDTIDAYIDQFDPKIRVILNKIRTLIEKEAPDATPALVYGVPTYKLNGNLVHFGAFKDHISFFPTSSPIVHFKKELSKYSTSKGTIKFPLNEPIPYELLKKIIRFRIKESPCD